MQGNKPELWEKLLGFLDDKLQFGLLENLRRTRTYHFEVDTLYLEIADQDTRDYLARPAVSQQLQLIAHDLVKVSKVIIRDVTDQDA